MKTPTKTIQDAPSWPDVQAAKDAWNSVRSTNAPDQVKQAAADAYKTAMRKCVKEIGLI